MRDDGVGVGGDEMAGDLAVESVAVGRTYKVHGPRRRTEPREIVALDGVSLEIAPGELVGLLGPNGAGKTTLIKILSTLLLPTSGRAYVCGFDVCTAAQANRRLISMVSGGETSGYGLLTVEENLWMFARFHGLESKVAKARIGDLLSIVGIADRKHTKVADLSTGLRQKMNFVRGFISDPVVVFLDEPTLGLDPQAAREVRRFIKDWIHDRPDRAILLTTHYMAEADELCDRLAIIDRGRLLAVGAPADLKRSLQREAIFELNVKPLGPRPSPEDMLESVPGVRQVNVAEHDGFTQLHLQLEADDVLGQVLGYLSARGSGLIALEKREPTLEDVFIDLVGRGLNVDTGLLEARDEGNPR